MTSSSMDRVGDVARRFGLNPQTLYYYERIGLIPPPQRNESGYRIFSDQDQARLSLIERAKSLGLTLDEIKEILRLKDGDILTCGAIHQYLLKKLEQIELKILHLQDLRSELRVLVHKCQHTLAQEQTDTDCGVFQVEEDQFPSAP